MQSSQYAKVFDSHMRVNDRYWLLEVEEGKHVSASATKSFSLLSLADAAVYRSARCHANSPVSSAVRITMLMSDNMLTCHIFSTNWVTSKHADNEITGSDARKLALYRCGNSYRPS
jgi:hypothetical protein